MVAVLALITGVTYAALTSQQAVLTGNTIESATASLAIGTDGTHFAGTQTGFDFAGVVPGGALVPVAGNSFYLQNSGTTGLIVKLAVSGTPVVTSGVDLSKVSVVITKVPGGTSQTFSLAALEAAYATGGLPLTDPLATGAINQYKLQVGMTADAFSGSSASIGALDLVFAGTAQ